MFISNCHTHTNYCDGKNTPREMIEAAIGKGFRSLGFSGHSPMTDNNEWSMSADGVKAYAAEINELKKEYADKIDILCGIELDEYHTAVKPEDFDYVIGAVHQLRKDGRIFDIDYTPDILKEAVDTLFSGSFVEMSRFYYRHLADFIIGTRIDVVAHIDLITKFNIDAPLFDENGAEYRCLALEAVDRILAEKPDILFEVNTGAMYRMGKKTPYPADFILRHINKQGGRITLTSDSHNTESLDFAFNEAVEYIKNCGFTEIYYFTSKGVKAFKI